MNSASTGGRVTPRNAKAEEDAQTRFRDRQYGAELRRHGSAPPVIFADSNGKQSISKGKHMEIKKAGSHPSGKGPADWFTGTVRIDPLLTAPDPALVSVLQSPSNQERGRPGIHTRLVRRSSSPREQVGHSGRAVPSNRSFLGMWCGLHQTRSIGMERPPLRP